MPTYEYRCDSCGAGEEVFQGLKDKPKRKCTACGKLRLQRLISTCIGFVAREATTLGQIAERNTKKMGAKIKEEEEKSGKTARKKATKELNEINRMTDAQKIKYIEEG